MPRCRIPGLPRNTGGVVQVGSAEELAKVLAFEGTDLSSEMIDFRTALWRTVQDVRERAEIYRFLTLATEQVCAAELLPRPTEELAAFGARVEVMRVGGKPPPRAQRRTRGLRVSDDLAAECVVDGTQLACVRLFVTEPPDTLRDCEALGAVEDRCALPADRGLRSF